MKWFKSVQLIAQKSSVALGDSFQIDGKSLRTRIGNKFSQVVGLVLSFEGKTKESTAAADMAAATAQGILSSITLANAGGPFCTQVTSSDLIQYLLRFGPQGYNSAAHFPVAALASSATAQDLRCKVLVPFAPSFFSNQGAFDDASCLSGSVPGELFKNGFTGTVNVLSTLGGNWILDTATASTLRVYAILAHTSKPVAYCHSSFQAVNSNESNYDLATDGRLTALQGLAIFDDAFSTFAASSKPTEPRLTVDDQVVQQLVSGQNLDEIADYGHESLSSLYGAAGCSLVSPGAAPHLGVTGRKFSVWGAREQHASAVRYLYSFISEPEIGHISQSLALEGVPQDQIQQVIDDYQSISVAPVGRASRLVISGVPAGLSLDVSDRAARAVVIDVTRAA